MVPGHSDRPGVLPVRTLDIFERDGRPVRSLRVFCPVREASTSLAVCANCSFAQKVCDKEVVCAPPGLRITTGSAADKPFFLGPDALALGTPLGAVCSLHSVAVRQDVPLHEARQLLERDATVVVLAADDQVKGILSAAEPARRGASFMTVDTRGCVLPESAPLIEAIEFMVHGQRRFVSVVAQDRRFVGLVRDIDVLRWAARRQLESSPGPEDPHL
ncbi:MAG: CBS domain-containing protein [Polyangiaceae bacterium]